MCFGFSRLKISIFQVPPAGGAFEEHPKLAKLSVLRSGNFSSAPRRGAFEEHFAFEQFFEATQRVCAPTPTEGIN